MKILIVEDSPPMARMIRRVIADCAAEIYDCDDGAAAILLYAERRPDLVLMDIELKQMNGITATGRIRQDFPDARIVIVTNYDDDDLRRAATTAGANGYILKDNLLALRPLLSERSASA